MAENKNIRPLSDSDNEIALLKGAFAGNKDILRSVRNLWLGYEITTEQRGLIRATFSGNEPLLKALRRKTYPIGDPSTDVGEYGDYWFGTDKEIVGADENQIRQVMGMKALVGQYLDTAFKMLTEETDEKIDLSFDPFNKDGKDPFQIKFLARNKFISTIETGLIIVKTIAGDEKETVEQARLRMLRDSNK